MKIVIVNKSDSTGGAAVVSRRLMEALRAAGADARMLVTEKLTDSPYVERAASKARVKLPFLEERLKIFVANGFDRSTLFKIDTASDGLPLWRHPLVAGADAVLLNWINQGMLSLKGIRKIAALGKPVIWTMHDMWCMTGICHHAGACEGYKGECGNCPLLGKHAAPGDLSHKVWKRKRGERGIIYVAVSNWLAAKAAESSLLRDSDVRVIPNAFNLAPGAAAEAGKGRSEREYIELLFGAARLDDPIKGLPVLAEATEILKMRYPEIADRLRLVTFGNVKNPAAFSDIKIAHRHLGMVRGDEAVRKVYEEGDILVSASSYETLPGTLVEAQAFGCIPVSFDRGGQPDIVEHGMTGFLTPYDEGAAGLAANIARAAGIVLDRELAGSWKKRMRESVCSKFSAEAVANAYIRLIEEKRKK